MYHLPYNKNLKQFSRYLRNNSTFAEVLLWNELKAKKVLGYSFNRQKPLGNYIVDFYCKKLGLVIEVDGSSHYTVEAAIKDEKRQAILEELGLSFLRFDDEEVRKDMNNVLRTIESWILEKEKNSVCVSS
ncbi:MAG: endonuclease domain-containing protein [Bacteroidetes bacterium]|nr:endonuclease domain-containing protein [Bacteroidota bacterium]